MIKIFTTNKNGKIELTKDELKQLLDDAYWEGFRGNTTTFTYQTPNWQPYIWCNTTAGSSIELNSNTNITSAINNKED